MIECCELNKNHDVEIVKEHKTKMKNLIIKKDKTSEFERATT